MPRPSSLVFFNEQDSPELAATFSPEVVTQLSTLQAGVAMGMRDLSDARAATIRTLEAAGVPVTAWVLLPRDEGYFATHDNPHHIEAACARLREWSADHRLSLSSIGLDFEPDLRDLDELMVKPLRTVGRWMFRRGRLPVLEAAARRYQTLIDTLRAARWKVETYQFPFVVDDRRFASRFWQRTLGALAVDADREVVMLYSSLLPAGHGMLSHYAPHCRAIAVGSTGGGIDPLPKLSWPELERDLLTAAAHASHVFVFSLEGCVAQQVLGRFASFDWNRPAPPSFTQRIGGRSVITLAGALARWF